MNMLRYINDLPISLTLKHYYVFDTSQAFLKDKKLSSAESWNALREHHPHFSIPENRQEWLEAAELRVKKDGQDGGLIKRAEHIVTALQKLGITNLVSLGVGGAGLEYQIKKKMPELDLTCSEYSSVAVERLKKVFSECNKVVSFDVRKDDWSLLANKKDPTHQLFLFYRVDIDLSNEDFEQIFQKMHAAGIQNILIIMCGRLTLRGLLNRVLKRISWIIHSVPYTFAGYLRTKTKMKGFWAESYTSEEVDFVGLPSFILRRK